MVVVTPKDDPAKQPLLPQQPHMDAPPSYPAAQAHAQTQHTGPSNHAGAPPHPQYVQYHTTPPVPHAYSYTPAPLPPHLIPHREHPFKRFLKAFGIALLIWFLAGLFMSSLLDYGWGAVSRHWQTTTPVAGDGSVVSCYAHDAGLDAGRTHTKWRDSRGSGVRAGHAQIELTLNADDALFFVTRGGAATGDVVLEESSDSRASVHVAVDWDPHARADSSAYLFQVCELSRTDGRGLGVYMPNWASGRDTTGDIFLTSFHVQLVVKLPAGNITKLTTETHNYAHDVKLAERVTFGSVALQGSNKPITVQTLVADSIELGTTNGAIAGTFKATRAINLHTTNRQIIPQITLGSSSVSTPTLNIQTTNGAIKGTARLVESTAFDAIVRTSNKNIDFAVSALPIGATLTMGAKTSNGPAQLTLPATFEGSVYQRTSNSAEPSFNYNVDGDPKGRGRPYQHEGVSTGKGERNDRVYWGKKDDHKVGQVNLVTSNGRVGVEIVPTWQ